MAAVLCLVFLPLLMASVAFMSASTVAAGGAFFLLGAIMLSGAFHMSRVWDEEKRDNVAAMSLDGVAKAKRGAYVRPTALERT
jgi:hypothetical protein